MTRNLQLNKEEFSKQYLDYMHDGKKDKEISELMFISKHTLYRYKKICNLPMIHCGKERLRYNKNGLTLELLEEAEKIGLCAHTINKRIRAYGWTLEDAVSIPPIPREKRRKWKQL